MKDEIRKTLKTLRGKAAPVPAKTVGGITAIGTNGKRVFKGNRQRRAASAEKTQQNVAKLQGPRNYSADILSIPVTVCDDLWVAKRGQGVGPTVASKRWASTSNISSVKYLGGYAQVGPSSAVTPWSENAASQDAVVVAGGKVPQGENRSTASDSEPTPEVMQREMRALAQKLRNDPQLSQEFFFKAGLVTETGEWKDHYRK